MEIDKWCIQGCDELRDLLNPNTNVIGNYIHKYYWCDDSLDYLNSRKWNPTS